MQFRFVERAARNLASVCLTLLVVTIAAQGQESAHKSKVEIRIKNFGQMDERFFRGGQPKERDYKALADLGIKTVIDLRDDPKRYEKPLVESLGMKYVNIPMIAKKYPPTKPLTHF